MKLKQVAFKAVCLSPIILTTALGTTACAARPPAVYPAGAHQPQMLPRDGNFQLVTGKAEHHVLVTGSCLREVSPDRGSIRMTVEQRDGDPRQAAAKATAQYEKLRNAVHGLKLKDSELRTSEFRVDQEWVWEKDRRVNKGFVARMGLRLESSDTARLGEAIARSAELGVQDVGELTLFVTPAKGQKEHDGCLVEAAEHAKRKAEELAKAVGSRVIRVIRLQEDAGGSPMPQPVPMFARASKSMEMDAVQVPTIEAGSESLRVTVSATFELGQ
jgi:uncharacterized protein YggE